MKKTAILTIISIFGIIILLGQQIKAEDSIGQIALEIKRGFLTIAGSGNINIGAISSNAEIEQRIIPIQDILQIRDATGLCSGHYTTLQIGDLTNGSNYINSDNISINGQAVKTILGVENPSLSLGLTISNQRGFTKDPTTYIYRSIGINCGNIGQYSATGDIKINIPANQPSGTYRGKIYYLLIDNN